MTVRDTIETAAWLHAQVQKPTGPKPGGSWEGLCLDLQHTARGIPAKYGTAWEAWLNAKHRHLLPNTDTVFHLIPRGVCLFYRSLIPGHEDGHVVFYDGMGRYGPLCATNDVPNLAGNVSFCNPLWPVVNWDMSLVGFTEDLNGVMLPIGKPATRVVHLAAIAEAFTHPNTKPRTWWVGYQIRMVQRALNSSAITGTVTASDVTKYAAFQRSLGYRGSDADGIPGKTSLTILGHHDNFEVI